MMLSLREAILKIAAVLLVSTASGPALSDDLPVPSGDVVLEVRGDTAVTNAEGVARFDIGMLKALPSETVSTGSIWYDGVRHFEGVSLRVLMDAVGARGTTIEAVAINDYKVTLPMPEADDRYPILAYAMDGAPMSVRDKGPIWVIYPFDSSTQYQQETYYSRSIWQLKLMNVRD